MYRMENRGKDTEASGRIPEKTPLDGLPFRTVHDATYESRRRPSVREVIRNHQRARSRLHREAEAMEFDPDEVYRALECIQENYDAFEGAERRPIVDHGENYVAFGLNGADWHPLFEVIRRGIDDEEKREYIARVVVKVMSDITGESWHSHNSLPLVLAEHEVRDVLAYHNEAYNGPRL